MQSQKCLTKEETPKNKAIVEKALGRGFDLGMLYDAKESQLHADSNLWSQSTINSNAMVYDRKEINTDFTADKTIHEKTSTFDIGAKLTMDFMGGMVHVAGAMKYLDESAESEQQINVEMLYHTTKYTRTMPKKTPKDHAIECKNINRPYTHVVTSVTYGMNCNFVFKRDLSSSESKSNIEGELEIAIKSIPSFSISGSGNVSLSESQNQAVNRTTLTVYGDMTLDPGDDFPTTYMGAIEWYANLPSFANKNHKALEVHLTPIEEICDPEDYILNEISDGMMVAVVNMLDELNQLEIKVNGLLKTEEAEKFQELWDNLNLYKKNLNTFVDDAKEDLQDLLPAIRAGDSQAEDDLIELLNKYAQSPFEFETSDQFLINRNREISSISFLKQSFKDEAPNIALVDYGNANDVGIILRNTYVIELDLNILTSTKLTEDFLSGNPQNEAGFWYNDFEINGGVGSLIRNFSKFANENAGLEDHGYMIICQVIKEGREDPTQMIALIDGQPKYENYSVASAPVQPVVRDITFNGFKFTVSRLNEFTNGVKVIVTNVYGDEIIEKTHEWSESDVIEDIDILIEDSRNIKPATVYSIQVQYKTEFGLGPKSESSWLFITAPSSEPNNAVVTEVTTNSLKVQWEKPLTIGNGIAESDLMYYIEISSMAEDGYTRRQRTKEHEASFDHLDDATAYNIKINAYLEQNDFGSGVDNETLKSLDFISTSPAAYVYQNSNPLAPKMIPSMPGEVTTSSVVWRWEAPSKLPDYNTLTYKVEWHMEGSDPVTADTNEELFTVENLSMATMYFARVKVITDLGESDWSGLIGVQTRDEESAISHVGDEIIADLGQIVENQRLKSSFCAVKDVTNSQTISFDKFLLNKNNIEGATFDTSSGTFVAGKSGSYQVMFSLEMVTDPSTNHDVWVVVNDVKVQESRIHSTQGSYALDAGFDNGSRDMVLELNAGDRVYLTHEQNTDQMLHNIIFCISSLNLDI